MSDNIDVNAALDAANKQADTVSLPASEVIRLRALEQSHSGLERDTASSFVERDLGSALKGANLVPGASDQLLKLWKDDFVSRRVDGRWIVEAKSGGNVEEVVRARLASGEYAHFIPAGSARGGANIGGGNSSPPNQRDVNGKPPTQIEMMAANYKFLRESTNGGRGLSKRQ
jgi:hypothetical protein